MAQAVEGTWETCIVDDDFEINTAYPYPIRRIGSSKMVSESISNVGYIQCRLNARTYVKHRIIAVQWIPNDDPRHKTQVDHINHDRTDNHIENLRWCSRSENNRNRTGNKGVRFTYLDELPDNAEPLDAYNGHEFAGLWSDYENEKLYLFNGVKYRELVATRRQGSIRYRVLDIENIYRDLSHKVLFG